MATNLAKEQNSKRSWQRSVLFLDVLRQRGNEQGVVTARPMATVLRFEHELLLSGRSLPRPRLSAGSGGGGLSVHPACTVPQKACIPKVRASYAPYRDQRLSACRVLIGCHLVT